MRKDKILGLFSIVFGLLVLSLFAINTEAITTSPTFVYPSSGCTLRGNIEVTFTPSDYSDVDGDKVVASNITLWDAAGNKMAENNSLNLSSYTLLNDTTALTDVLSTTWKIQEVLGNNTAVNTTSSSFTIDNTDPSRVEIIMVHEIITEDDLTEIKCEGVDAIDTALSYSVTVTKPDTTTTVYTEDNKTMYWKQSFTISDFTGQLGEYKADCTATDNAAHSVSATQKKFRIEGDDVEAERRAAEKRIARKDVFIPVLIVFVLILATAGVAFLTKKK